MDELCCTTTIVERELNGAGDNPLLMDGEWIEGVSFPRSPCGTGARCIEGGAHPTRYRSVAHSD